MRAWPTQHDLLQRSFQGCDLLQRSFQGCDLLQWSFQGCEEDWAAQVVQREAEARAGAAEVASWRAGLQDAERRATADADGRADAIVGRFLTRPLQLLSGAASAEIPCRICKSCSSQVGF